MKSRTTHIRAVTRKLKKIKNILVILAFLLISCVKKQKANDELDLPKIEIYQPKERIVSNFGNPITDEWILSEFFDNDTTLFQDKYLNDCSSFLHRPNYQIFTKVDPKSNKLIYAGPFSATTQDLKENPFIKDEEIIGFDFKESKIRISSTGVSKIMSLKPNMNHSRQFVITIDKMPILTGYFFNTFSSSYVSHFYIEHLYKDENFKSNSPKISDYEIFYNPKSEFDWEPIQYNFKKNAKFYKAFKETNKLIE
ncbi:hypothetical protein [Zunongwangia sp.]|uniref:hypothetical protein n=1 Tax=Zunongwangia sp. TaxID=1965325 RepID=UPI003AA97E8E